MSIRGSSSIVMIATGPKQRVIRNVQPCENYACILHDTVLILYPSDTPYAHAGDDESRSSIADGFAFHSLEYDERIAQT